MPRKYTYDDPRLNEEFDAVHQGNDLYVVSQEQPTSPRPGMQWYNPQTNILKIWDGKVFNTH